MIQLIASRPLLPAEAAGSRWLSDPDHLLDIAERLSVDASSSSSLADAFSFILNDLRMAGTWKRTSRGRLPQAEHMICAHLEPSADEINVLDLGASDGITTLDLVTALRASVGARCRVYLTDLNLWLLRYRSGPVVEYRAANGEPVMVRIGPVGLRLSQQRQTQTDAGDPIAALYLKCRRLRQSMRLDARIALVHPRVAHDPAVVILELDCLSRMPELVDRFLAVRACNVLNVGYFSPQQLTAAVANLHAYLREGGCLVVSRNRDGPAGETEDGSVWQKSGARFVHRADFGVGSEIKAIVDGWSQA